MFIQPKHLVYLSIISIVLGIIVKILGIDIGAMTGLMSTYPLKPLSFLHFSDTILLLAIALILLRRDIKVD